MKEAKNAIVSVQIESERSVLQGYEIHTKSFENYVKDKPALDYIRITKNNDLRPQFLKYDLESLFKKYKTLCVVDADTIIRPNSDLEQVICQNKTISAVPNFGSLEWVCRTIENCSLAHNIFKSISLDYHNYFNTGLIIVDKIISPTLQDFLQFVRNNKDKIYNLTDKLGMGQDQTIFNLFLKHRNITVNRLPYIYNIQDLPRRNCLNDEDLFWSDMGDIFHFNCGVKPSPKYWMEKLYQHYAK